MGQIASNHLIEIVDAVPHGGRILEYGCGDSTVEFAKLLWDDVTLVTVEHEESWLGFTTSMIDTVDTLISIRCYHAQTLFAGEYFGTAREEEPSSGAEEYVTAGDGMAPYDVIFIDGICRNDCLIHARSILKPGGIVFLHDAHRSWYECGKVSYRELGKSLACGGHGNGDVMLWWGRPKC